jgi:hypothetical protein
MFGNQWHCDTTTQPGFDPTIPLRGANIPFSYAQVIRDAQERQLRQAQTDAMRMQQQQA